MRNRLIAAVLALGGTAAMTAAVAPDAVADGTVPHLIGASAGLTVNGLNGTTKSGPIAATTLSALTGGHHKANAVGSATVPNVGTLGAISTDETTTGSADDTLTLTSHAHSANINLLSGLVTAAAADTTATTTYSDGVAQTSADTTFTSLKVAGTPVDASPAKNTTITVPSVATVTVNYQNTLKPGPASSINAAAIVVRLLSGSARTVVQLDPVRATLVQSGTGYAPLGGFAYAARVSGGSGSTSLSVGPLPLSDMPQGGTGGSDVTRSLGSLDLGSGASGGVASSTVNGIATDLESRSTTTARVSDLSLFGGLITAGAIRAQAQVDMTAGGAPVATETVNLFNLRIAGQTVPVNVPANTVIPLPGVGKVIVNYQHSTANTADAKALVVQLGSASNGLPAGASIAVGVANATFTP